MGKHFPAGNLTEVIVENIMHVPMPTALVEFTVPNLEGRIGHRTTVTLHQLLQLLCRLDPDQQLDLVMIAWHESSPASPLEDPPGEEDLEHNHLIELIRQKIDLLAKSRELSLSYLDEIRPRENPHCW